ncbi:MAG TPA: hypothetical protein V6C65_04620 [Allocoleopsis sp.]
MSNTQKAVLRRHAISQAQSNLLVAIQASPRLTPIEWIHVFHRLCDRVMREALEEEWKEESSGER